MHGKIGPLSLLSETVWKSENIGSHAALFNSTFMLEFQKHKLKLAETLTYRLVHLSEYVAFGFHLI